MIALERYKEIRSKARKKDAPKHIKKMIEKLKKMEKQEKEINKNFKEFKKK